MTSHETVSVGRNVVKLHLDPLFTSCLFPQDSKPEPGPEHQEHDLGAEAADHQRVRGGPHLPRRHRQEVGL